MTVTNHQPKKVCFFDFAIVWMLQNPSEPRLIVSFFSQHTIFIQLNPLPTSTSLGERMNYSTV